MLNPHPELSPELRNQSALQSLTYDQMRVAANCLWNLFAARTAMQEQNRDGARAEPGSRQGGAVADALSACSDNDELVCQTVYNAFENCLLALEAAHKAQKGA